MRAPPPTQSQRRRGVVPAAGCASGPTWRQGCGGSQVGGGVRAAAQWKVCGLWNHIGLCSNPNPLSYWDEGALGLGQSSFKTPLFHL